MIWWHSILLGAVEGLTEFLPVSSTGHLVLTGRLLGLPQTEFLKSFDIAIQLGAILAVLFLYARYIVSHTEAIGKIMAAFIPTAVIGFVLYKWIKNVLMEKETVILWALLLGGIVLIAFDRLFRENQSAELEVKDIPYRKAFWIGVFQALAVIPGVSRSASTILGGLMLGVPRKAIVEFSFLLAIPTISAATVLDLSKTSLTFSSDMWMQLGIGFIVSFIVAVLCIRLFLRYIQKNSFAVFGYYRIAVAVLFWTFIR